MEEEVLLVIVYDALLGEESILIDVRNGLGVNETQYSELVVAIKKLILIYTQNKSVPKKLALAFTDISNYFYSSAGLYSELDFEKLEDKAHELNYLGQQLFSD